MSTIEFIELREKIDHLIEETKLWIKKKSIHESSKRLENSNALFVNLKRISRGNIQDRVLLNRTYELEHLAEQIDEILIRGSGDRVCSHHASSLLC